MKKFLSLVCAVFMTVLTFGQSYGILVNGKTYFAGEPAGVNEGFTQYLAHVSVKAGDYCQLYDAENKAAWVVTLNSWSVEGFALNNDRYEVTVDGCYDFYIKLKYEQDELYIGNGSNCSEGVDITGGGEEESNAIKLTFTYYDKVDGDGSGKLNTVEAIFDAASQAYVSEVNIGTNVYAGRKYKEGNDSIFSNLKLGSSSAAGELKFTLATPTEVDSIVFRAAMYAAAEGGDGFSVNGTAYTLSAGKLVFEDKVWKPEGEVSTIDIVQTKASKGRFFLTSITIYPKTGDTPEPPTPGETKYYAKNNWDGGEWTWKEMTKNADDDYQLVAVFGGTGVNINTAESDEGAAWYPIEKIEAFDASYEPATLGALDTVVFMYTPSEKMLAALIIGKYAEPVTPPTPGETKYYAKNNWDGGEWTWKEMTKNADDDYQLVAVFGGTGVNINTAESDEGSAWYPIEKIEAFDASYEPATLGALDTVVFMYTPSEKMLAALIIGKYAEPVTPPTPGETKYYAKNNWDGGEWIWKEMTKNADDDYQLVAVFGGTGVNINTAESDEGAAWYAAADIAAFDASYEPATLSALDTIVLMYTPSEKMLAALIIGKYAEPVTPPTPGETKYYAKNNWDGGEWIWKEMTKNADDDYQLVAVFGGTGVNINTAESDEGAAWYPIEKIEAFDASYEPATLGAMDTIVLMYTPSEKMLAALIIGKYAEPVTPPTPEGPVYSVAGSKALLGAEWNEKEGNEMTLDTEDGLYKLLCADVTLAAGTEYKFKIVTNHNWNNPNYPAQDKVLTVEQDGKYDVTITFNAETKDVAYVAEFKGGVIVEKHYLIVGDAAIANGEDWNNDVDVNLMTSADEGLTYTLVIPNVKMIANKEYGYKVVEKGSWTEYFPNKVGGGNEYFSVTESAVYTLTYTFTLATSQCVVLASKTGELPEPKLKDGFYLAGSFAGVDAWTIDDLNENKFFKYVEGDETYALYTLTANLAVGDKFKVVSVAQDVIMNWLPDGQGNEIVVTANYAGEAKVINLYFDYKEGRFSIWIEPNMPNGFYLVGSMNNWTPAKDYLFAQNPDNTAEYVLSTILAENDLFKVVYVYEGEIQNDQWYPAAENSDYTVDATHAGKKDIYFRPDYQGGEDWYYGCIYVAANEPTGIEETIAAGKAVKVLRNGQILILKGDKMYNVMGAVIR